MEVNRKNSERPRRLREMAQRVLDELGEVDLDHVPVERIAAILGISRATFFRHFESKDQLVVLAFIGDADAFASALPAGDFAPERPVWPELRACFEPILLSVEADGLALRRRLTLLRDRPMLGLKLRRARLPQIEALSQALIAKGLTPEAASALAGAAVSTLERSVYAWATQPEASLRALMDQAFFHLARGY